MEQFQRDMIANIIDDLETDEVKKLAMAVIQDLPEYWYDVAASSSGKYHPAYTVGPHGLFIHSVVVLKFASYMLEIEQYKTQFKPEERDAIKLGAFCHDGNKHGTDSHGHTIFSHPIVMAESVRKYKGKGIASDEIIEFVANLIETHMGEWNTNKREPNTILPKPTSLGQQLLHLADYLASRKDVEIHFDNESFEKPTKENYVFNFGRYKGQTFEDVLKNHPDYLQWLKDNNYSKEPLKTFLKEV